MLLRDAIALWVPRGSMPDAIVSRDRYKLYASTTFLLWLLLSLFMFTTTGLYARAPILFFMAWRPIPSFIEWYLVRNGGNAIYFFQILLLEVATYVFSGFLGASSFLLFVYCQLIEFAITYFKRIVAEPCKGRCFHRSAQALRSRREKKEQSEVEEAPSAPAASTASSGAAGYVRIEVRGSADLGLRHTMVMWVTDSAAQFVEMQNPKPFL